MSYDLFVFDVKAAPQDLKELIEWYAAETASEDAGNDPAVLSEPLRTWFEQVAKTFPALNGPTAPKEVEDIDNVGDYNMRPNSIYVSFGWSQAELANRTALEAARDCGVGILDPQVDDGDVFMPQGTKLKGRPRLLARLFGRG